MTPQTPDREDAGPLAYLRRRPYLLCLAAIAALAMALRLAWIAYANTDPYDGRVDDTLFFDFAARSLAAGEGFRGFALQQTAQWPPGYPLLLAGFYKLFGHSVILAKLLNVLAGGAVCALIYAVAAKVFNRRVGLLAALILALFPGSIYFSTLLMTESIFTALVALLLLLVLMWVLERRDVSPVRAFLLGVLFGAAALFRAEAPVLLLVVLVVWRLAVPSWQAFLPPAGFLIAGAVLAVAPWTVRNAITMHRFIPISNGVGHTLLAGQQDDPYDPRHDFPEMHLRIKYQDLPFPERETRVEDEALREALDFMFSHPGYEVQLAFEKLYHLYEDDSGALQWIRAPAAPLGEEWQIDPSIIPPSARQEEPPVYIPPAAEEWWSRLADGYYYVVLAAALAGAPLWFSLRDRKRLLLVLVVVGWTAVHLLFMPRPRYHAPLLPVLSLWAAVTLVCLWDRVIVRFAGRRRLTVGEDHWQEDETIPVSFNMKSLPAHRPIAAGLAKIRRRLATPEIVLLLGVFLLALALRLAWIAYANPDPGDGRFDDTVFYDQSAQALAAGKGFIGFAHQQTAQWPPGYSLVLAAVYKLFGHSIIAAKPLNALAGGAACLLIYAVAAKVFNRRVGLLAALIFALFPSSIYFSTLLLTESIFTAAVALLLLLVLMWALERKDGSPLRAFLLGVLFGAAALFRAEAPALLLAVLVVWRLAVPSWRAFLRPAGFLVAGAVLAVAPWTVRNAIAMHAFVPISTGAGHTLLQGQQDDPYGSGRNLPQTSLLLKYADLPFPERETKVQDEALREALDFMFSHPLYEVQLAFEKFYHLYRDDSSSLEWIRGGWLHASEIEWLKDMPIKSLDDVGEPVVTISPGAEERWSFLADGYYYTVMTFAIAGAPLWFSVSDKKRLLLVLFVASWTLVHLVFMPNTRYHTPLMPIFCLWAAVALVASWDRLVAAIKAGARSDRI